MINNLLSKNIFLFFLLSSLVMEASFSSEKKAPVKVIKPVAKPVAKAVEEATGPPKKETTEQEDIINDFKETKFLQIDQLDVPAELKRIEGQIRQNALDVIISSKTHTPVYAQKRVSGYSESYKKFHGLEVQIVPIPNEQDFYSLNFFYYNWTNRKFDKRLRRRISKYNVLNELRFALYELLLGKQFVFDHKDEIEKQNFDRISAVRESEEEIARQNRKKKKLEKKKEEEELELKEEKEEKKKNKLKREELEKKEKALKTPPEELSQNSSLNVPNKEEDDEDLNSDDPDELAKLKKKKEDENNKKKAKKKDTDKDSKKDNSDENSANAKPEAPKPNEDAGETIPSTATLYALGSFFTDNVITDGYLHASTNLRYLGFGARYIQEQDIPNPRGMRFSLKVGLPIKKDNYAFPVYRSFETEIYKKFFSKHVQFFGGLDLSPIYFVNLAEKGEGLLVFENDIFWMKGGVGFNQEVFGKEIDLRIMMFKSLMVKNNVKKALAGSALAFNLAYQHTPKHGAEISVQQRDLLGDLTVSSKSLYFSYTYKFEN